MTHPYTIRWTECKTCGCASPYHGDACLACAIFGACSVDLSPALDLRALPRRAFGFRWLHDWLMQADSPYYCTQYSVQDSIIKACEHLRNMRLSTSGRTPGSGKQLVRKLCLSRNNSAARRNHAQTEQLIQRLLTRYSGCCCYCGSPCGHGEGGTDTILPLHLQHTATKLQRARFYALAESAGLLGWACADCNGAKTVPEVAALAIWRWWRWGRRELRLYGLPRKRQPMPPLPALGGPDLRDGDVTQYSEAIIPRLPLIALRVASDCVHMAGNGQAINADLELAVDLPRRAIQLGCPECTSGLIRIGVLTRCS